MEIIHLIKLYNYKETLKESDDISREKIPYENEINLISFALLFSTYVRYRDFKNQDDLDQLLKRKICNGDWELLKKNWDPSIEKFETFLKAETWDEAFDRMEKKIKSLDSISEYQIKEFTELCIELIHPFANQVELDGNEMNNEFELNSEHRGYKWFKFFEYLNNGFGNNIVFKNLYKEVQLSIPKPSLLYVELNSKYQFKTQYPKPRQFSANYKSRSWQVLKIWIEIIEEKIYFKNGEISFEIYKKCKEELDPQKYDVFIPRYELLFYCKVCKLFSLVNTKLSNSVWEDILVIVDENGHRGDKADPLPTFMELAFGLQKIDNQNKFFFINLLSNTLNYPGIEEKLNCDSEALKLYLAMVKSFTKIDGLEVVLIDFPDKKPLMCRNVKEIMEKLGGSFINDQVDGSWRVPTQDELNVIYQYRNEIGCLDLQINWPECNYWDFSELRNAELAYRGYERALARQILKKLDRNKFEAMKTHKYLLVIRNVN